MATVVSSFFVGQSVLVRVPGRGARLAVVVGVSAGKAPNCITVLNDGNRASSRYRVSRDFCTPIEREKMKTYLGDGAYAELADGRLMLTAEDGIRATDTVILEPEAWAELLAFVRRNLRDDRSFPWELPA